ncbi:hypothetical protein ACFQZC_36985 [Streptacidiphilus monticola]
MGINALTQMLVPPPKYSVDRLVPCRLGSSTRVEELFIIQRGARAWPTSVSPRRSPRCSPTPRTRTASRPTATSPPP